MKYAMLILTVLIGVACTGKSGSADLYTSKDQKAYSKFINAKKMPQNPNLTLDKSIVNNEYPIEIALYENNKFYYDLPNLGTGTGKWKYKDGKIELIAKRSLFDMYIEVYGGELDFSKLSISFTDRRGHKALDMENNNIQ